MKKLAALATLLVLPLAACTMREQSAREGKEGDEGNEVKVAINDVPPAVRTTLDQQAPGVTITQVDKEEDQGKVIYEADAVLGGQNYEIKVADDGHLISKKVDKEDNDGEASDKDEKSK